MHECNLAIDFFLQCNTIPIPKQIVNIMLTCLWGTSVTNLSITYDTYLPGTNENIENYS